MIIEKKNTLACLAIFGMLSASPALAADLSDGVDLEPVAEQPAPSGNFATTELQLLYGDGFLNFAPSGENDRLTGTVQHFSTWDYGNNFFFVDLAHNFDSTVSPQNSFFGEFNTFVSAPKVLGLETSGIIRDFGVDAGISAADDFLAGLIGPRVSFNAPGFDVLDVSFFSYTNLVDPLDRDLDTAFQLTTVWDVPFQFSDRHKFRFTGFLDYVTPQGSGVVEQIVTSPQIRFDVSNYLGGPERAIEAGVDVTHFTNQFGIEGRDETTVNALLVFKLH